MGRCDSMVMEISSRAANATVWINFLFHIPGPCKLSKAKEKMLRDKTELLASLGQTKFVGLSTTTELIQETNEHKKQTAFGKKNDQIFRYDCTSP